MGKKKKEEQLPKTKLQAKMGSESSFEYEISPYEKTSTRIMN